MKKDKTVTIGGVEYIPKDSISFTRAKGLDDMPYVIVRTYSAGVFAGYLEKKKDQNAIMRNARRLWYWDGAASLSQLAMEGVSKPEKCKFPCEVDKIELDQVIEVIECTQKAKDSIASVTIWKK
tara:strand:- start:288 stop:659 length:372 start_codon:yes stop_codon:yes gene_type:complete